MHLYTSAFTLLQLALNILLVTAMDHYEDYGAQVLEQMPSSPFATSNPYGYHVDIMSDEVCTNQLAGIHATRLEYVDYKLTHTI